MDLNELSNNLDAIKTKVDLLYDSLVGDLKDQGKPGLIVRLDRVEQSIFFLKRYGWLLFSLIVSCAVTIFIKA